MSDDGRAATHEAAALILAAISDLEGQEQGSLPDTRAALDVLVAVAGRTHKLEEALLAAEIVVDNYGRHWRRDDAYYKAADLIRALVGEVGTDICPECGNPIVTYFDDGRRMCMGNNHITRREVGTDG